jgi:NAD-dependent DNA ligase
MTLDKFGVRKAKKTLKAIESAKGCDLYRFVNALNIDTVGERSKDAHERLQERLKEVGDF